MRKRKKERKKTEEKLSPWKVHA